MSPTVDTAATLVRLANRIGEFFAAFPEREEALDGIAQHLAKFWEPRMRRALYAHLDGAAQGEGLAPLVREAVLTRRGRIEPLSAAPARLAAGS
jgi:formate dehydrogenase subunit delta